MADSLAYQTSDEIIRSEAYQHGRTQGRLRFAREALTRIAAGDVRNMTAARAVAKMALEMSAATDKEALPAPEVV